MAESETEKNWRWVMMILQGFGEVCLQVCFDETADELPPLFEVRRLTTMQLIPVVDKETKEPKLRLNILRWPYRLAESVTPNQVIPSHAVMMIAFPEERLLTALEDKWVPKLIKVPAGSGELHIAQ